MDLLRGEGGRGSVKLLCPILDVGRGMTLGDGRRAPWREVSIGQPVLVSPVAAGDIRAVAVYRIGKVERVAGRVVHPTRGGCVARRVGVRRRVGKEWETIGRGGSRQGNVRWSVVNRGIFHRRHAWRLEEAELVELSQGQLYPYHVEIDSQTPGKNYSRPCSLALNSFPSLQDQYCHPAR